MKFIFSIILLILSGILFFTIVNPLYGDISNLKKDVAAYNVALDNSKELQKDQDNLVKTYQNINPDDRTRLEHFLPNTVNNIKFILEIERIANSHNMPLKNIRFEAQDNTQSTKTTANGNTTIVTSSDPSAALPYGSFPIEFTTEGDYPTFIQFLKDIESNLRLVDVQSVDFSVPQPDKGNLTVDPNIYTFNLRIVTYWLK